MMAEQRKLNAFDLVKVGLSSTLAITIFIVIGHVVRNVAGPSAILSVLLAAFIALLVGTFYAELNCTVLQSLTGGRLTNVVISIESPEHDASNRNESNNFNSSEWLMPSYVFVHTCHGEFPAFIIAWNLIMEYIVCLALVSKALVRFFDAIVFDGTEFSLQHLLPMSWWYSDHFDVVAFFVPISIGVPMLLILRRNSILNTVSIAFSLLIVVLFLIFGIINADISNWNTTLESPNNDADRLGTGGFFAYGLNGMFRGATIILFAYIAFDTMIMSKAIQQTKQQSTNEKIENFNRTITNAILSIKAGLFLCMLGMALALTTIQPYHLLDKDLPILSAVDTIFSANDVLRTGTRFIILIAGFVAFVGSLYALLHAFQRTIQTMLSTSTLLSVADDSTFKLFGKFDINSLRAELQKPSAQIDVNQTPTDGCGERDSVEWKSLPSFVGCLLFTLFSGVVASLFAIENLINMLSIGTLLMLYATTIDIIILRYSTYMKVMLRQTPTENSEPRRSISLISILLCIYCLLSAILVIYLKSIQTELITVSVEVTGSISGILAFGLLAIVFIMGVQQKRNAVFELSISRNPLFPAAALFGCIYLFTVIDELAWYRLGIWMMLGILFYSAVWLSKRMEERQVLLHSVASNNGFVPEDEKNEMTGSNGTLKLEDDSCPNALNASSESIEMHTIESVDAIEENVEIVQLTQPTEIKSVQCDVNKFDEISSADDIKGHSQIETVSNSSADTTTDEITKNIMEKVLNQNDVELKHESEQFPRFHDVHLFDDSSDEEREVKAVVHVSSETMKLNEIDSDEPKTSAAPPMKENSGVMTRLGTINPASGAHQSPNFHIDVYEAIPKQKLIFQNDSERMAFKTRLETLFGNSKPNERPKSRFYSPTLAHRPRFVTTNSAPESLVLSNDVIISPVQQCQSPFDETPSKIPIPPIFNQQLYDTVGRRNKTSYKTVLSPPSSHQIDIEAVPEPETNKKGNLSRSQAYENLTMISQNDGQSPETIKQKLEEIFSRGRTQSDDVHVDNETIDQSNDDVLRRVKPTEPFDTVKRQKIIFSTVLKSIGPDCPTSLRRTSSIASADINNRESVV